MIGLVQQLNTTKTTITPMRKAEFQLHHLPLEANIKAKFDLVKKVSKHTSIVLLEKYQRFVLD